MTSAQWGAVREELAKLAIRLRDCESLATARAVELLPNEDDLSFIGRQAYVRGALAGTCMDAARVITRLCEPRRRRRSS